MRVGGVVQSVSEYGYCALYQPLCGALSRPLKSAVPLTAKGWGLQKQPLAFYPDFGKNFAGSVSYWPHYYLPGRPFDSLVSNIGVARSI